MEDKIFEKIQKLLALAEDKSNEHESAVAAGQAAKLMRKYNLTHADVISKDINDNLEDSAMFEWGYRGGGSIPIWLQTMSTGLAGIFDCIVQIRYDAGDVQDSKRPYRIHVMGHKSDVEIVKYLAQYIISTANRFADLKWEECKNTLILGSSGKKSFRAGYMRGFCRSMINRVDSMYKEEGDVLTSSGTSLVLIKKNAVEARWGKPRYGTVSAPATGGYMSGRADGKVAPLHKGVSSSPVGKDRMIANS